MKKLRHLSKGVQLVHAVQVGLREFIMLHIGEVFPGRNDSDVSTDDYLVKPELGKKWNEFVKRQKVELDRGGALK